MVDDKKKQADQTPTDDMEKGGEATATDPEMTDMSEDTEMSDVEDVSDMDEDTQMENDDEKSRE